MNRLLVDGVTKLKIPLSEAVVEKEMEFLDEMLRWNQQINLTSITDRDEAIEKHLLDSLMLLEHLGDAKTVLDMGSGAGFPSIPLAIAEPNVDFVSVDSVGKKINFQKHIKRRLDLKNIVIQQSRVEALNQIDFVHKKYDLVLSRAFSSLKTSIKYAVPLLLQGGRVIAMKGPEGLAELQEIQQLLNNYHFEKPQITTYLLPYSRAERVLIILKSSC